MNLDILLKRGFPALVSGSIAVAAYLQASGLSFLLEETLLAGAPAAASQASSPRTVVLLDDHATSATPILDRNPFDSRTGPLDKPKYDAEKSVSVPEPGDPANDDPTCESVRVLAIVDSGDPAWSFVAIGGAGQKPVLRRLGDEVGDRKLNAIAWDRVWLTAAGARCQLRLGDNAQMHRPAPPAARKPVAKPNLGAVPPELAAKIRRVSDREFSIDRSALDSILENQADFMRSIRAVPTKEGNKVVGLRLLRVASNSLLAMLGLRNGDQLRSINGFDLTDPQKALEAYARLRGAEHLTIALQRGGQDMSIDYQIR